MYLYDYITYKGAIFIKVSYVLMDISTVYKYGV